MTGDDARTSRRRHSGLVADLGRGAEPPPAAAGVRLVRPVEPDGVTYPSGAGPVMIPVVDLAVSCDEAEGALPTFTPAPDTDHFLALWDSAGAVPEPGEGQYLATLVGGLWTFGP